MNENAPPVTGVHLTISMYGISQSVKLRAHIKDERDGMQC